MKLKECEECELNCSWFLPQTPCVQLAAERRLLLLCYPSSLDVWQLGAAVKNPNNLSANSFLKLSQEPVHLLQLQAKEDEWIVCAAISLDGQYLAYSTESVVRIYQLTPVMLFIIGFFIYHSRN